MYICWWLCCVCICTFICVNVGAYMPYIHVCGGQGNLRCQSLPPTSFVPGSHFIVYLGIWQATWASSAQEFASLYLSCSCRRARIIDRCATCLAFLCVFWGFELRSSHLHGKHLCPLSHLPSSSPILFKCICQKMWNCILICICKLHYFSAELHRLSLNESSVYFLSY